MRMKMRENDVKMERNKAQTVYTTTWCPICENQISENYKDIEKLLGHIRTCHPPVPSAERIVKKKWRFHDLKKTSKRLNPFKRSAQSSKKKREVIFSESRGNIQVEKILCPRCKVESLPLLLEKRSRKFITNCRLGSICLLGCWPLCFVPLMISDDKRVRMVCPLCGYDYGTYDVRNAKDTTVIVDTTENLLGTTKIFSITSTTKICQSNENNLPANIQDKSIIIKKSNSGKFIDNSAKSKKNQGEEFIHGRNKCDASVECVTNEKNAIDPTIFPCASINHPVHQLDEKNRIVKMETCKFRSANTETDPINSFQQHRIKFVHEQPISKYCDDKEYSSLRQQFAMDKNPKSTVCQHSHCRNKNLNDCCGNNVNTKLTRDRIIYRNIDNVNDKKISVRDNSTSQYYSTFNDNENFNNFCYQHNWC